MKTTTLLAQPCRAYDLVLDDEARDKHFALLREFVARGILSPRGGSTGPNMRRYTGVDQVDGAYRVIHFLAEEVCDEYEAAMGLRVEDED